MFCLDYSRPHLRTQSSSTASPSSLALRHRTAHAKHLPAIYTSAHGIFCTDRAQLGNICNKRLGSEPHGRLGKHYIHIYTCLSPVAPEGHVFATDPAFRKGGGTCALRNNTTNRRATTGVEVVRTTTWIPSYRGSNLLSLFLDEECVSTRVRDQRFRFRDLKIDRSRRRQTTAVLQPYASAASGGAGGACY